MAISIVGIVGIVGIVSIDYTVTMDVVQPIQQ